MTKCAITGLRDIKYFEENKLKRIKECTLKVIHLLHTKYNVDTFFCGMALGADLMAASEILKYKEAFNKKIEIIPTIPCLTQTKAWGEKDKMKYKNILKMSQTPVIISEKFTNTCMLDRNKYMVDHSDILLGIYDGRQNGGTKYTIDYALKNKKKIILINTNSCRVYKNFK